MRSLSRFNFPRAPFTPTTAFPATSVSSRQLYSKRAPSPYSGTGSPVRSGWLRHPLVSVANPERIALAVPDSTRVHCTGRPFFPPRGNPTASAVPSLRSHLQRCILWWLVTAYKAVLLCWFPAWLCVSRNGMCCYGHDAGH